MKKSEAYHLAQIAVLGTQTISPEGKTKVLRVLFEDEDVAIYCEKKEAEKAAETDAASDK